ncbi:MAG: sugar transferase [Deltaproteobacteria bacterium]|uniref:Sugar transferase n=1 Tax=Candidatus Zymogenus saltonus TaxID=2844893 RepID=A0A9D8KJY2_9DELT|nr:sugar transferase [Candidatus Zymogenus saltonus]
MNLYGAVKRVVDVMFSILGIVLLSPVLLLVSALIFVFMGRPILFRQVRPGKGGAPFTIYKFRTMTEAFDRHGNPLPDEERLTPVGSALRKTSIDELPELINVLKGDMSLVGPRPLLMEYLPLYNKEQARRHDVRPGITGLAQIMGRNAIDWDEKFKYDTYYVENIGFSLDLKILFMTLFSVFTGSGVNRSDGTPMPKFSGNRPTKKNEANI